MWVPQLYRVFTRGSIRIKSQPWTLGCPMAHRESAQYVRWPVQPCPYITFHLSCWVYLGTVHASHSVLHTFCVTLRCTWSPVHVSDSSQSDSHSDAEEQRPLKPSPSHHGSQSESSQETSSSKFSMYNSVSQKLMVRSYMACPSGFVNWVRPWSYIIF